MLFMAIPQGAVTNVMVVLRIRDPEWVPGRARPYGSEQIGRGENHPKSGKKSLWNGPLLYKKMYRPFF